MYHLIKIVIAMIFGSITVCAQTQDAHYDWFNRYIDGEAEREQAIMNIGAPNPTLQYNWIGYNFSRYIMPGWLQMYRVTRNTDYLDRFVALADLLFSPGSGNGNLFRDVGACALPAENDPAGANGHDEGFLGWGNNERAYLRKAIGTAVQPGVWIHCRMRVENVTIGGHLQHRIQLWINGTSEYLETYDPDRVEGNNMGTIGQFDAGTVALLSGWSETRFRNVLVRQNTGSGWTTFYDLNNSLQTFDSDWHKIDITSTYGSGWTADWSLDSESHEIYCNACDQNPPGYPNDINWPGRGRYAALTLIRENAWNLLNIEIEYDMMIQRRNWTLAESGVALRYSYPMTPPIYAYLENRVTRDESIAPSEWGFNTYVAPEIGEGGEILSQFQFVQTDARYIVGKLLPANQLQVALHGRWLNDIDQGTWQYSWWIAPWEENGANNPRDVGFYNERSTPDGVFGGIIGKFGELVFSDPNLNLVYGDIARSYLTTFENNISSKWNAIQNRDADNPDYMYGDGRFVLGFGGWRKGLFWSGWLGRYGAMMGPFSRLSNSGNWNSSLSPFYQNNYYPIVNEMPNHATVEPDGAYLWNEMRGFIGAFVKGYSDMGHTGELVRLLIDARDDNGGSGITDIHLANLAKVITNRAWNLQVGEDCSISKYINGVDQLARNEGSTVFDGWPHLARWDFRIWEIFDEYGSESDYINPNPSHPENNRYYMQMMDEAYRIHESDMVYTVRYGIPRNLRLITIQGCNRNGYVLRWEPPSDYPNGREIAPGTRLPGTRLQYYSVFRRSSSDGGVHWNDWHRVARIDIQDKLGHGIHGIQNDYNHPFWTDPVANTDSLYSYTVRTQDWSAAITNESLNSNEIQVQYQSNKAQVQIPARSPGVVDITANGIEIQGNMFIDGLWYIPGNMLVNPSCSLIVRPNAVLAFQSGTGLLVRGTLNAIDDIDPCYITFQGEEEIPGSWLGIDMLTNDPESHHDLYHCRLKYGVNNIEIYNDESQLEQCDIFGASEHGVVYGRGSSHMHRNNHIHDNTSTNLLIMHRYTKLTIDRDFIEKAGAYDGISIIDNAAPTIDYCTVSENHRHGIVIVAATTPPDTFPQILHSTIFQNGSTIAGNGIQSYNSQFLLRSSSLVDNSGAGVVLENNSHLIGGRFFGEAGLNNFEIHPVNLRSDNSSATFGVTVPNGNSYGHSNCFLQPSTYQIEATNGSMINAEEDYFNPDQLFSADKTSYIWTTDPPLGSCTGPITVRIDPASVAPTATGIYAKGQTAGAMRQIVDFLASGNVDAAKQALKDIILSGGNIVDDDVLTLAYRIFRLARDRSILAALNSAVAQGRCDDAKYRLLAALCYRELGMYKKGLMMLAPVGSGLPVQLGRRVEMERAHLHTLLYGDSVSRAESKRLKREFNGDPLVALFADYLPFIDRQKDVPDTTMPKEGRANPVQDGYSLANFPNPPNPSTLITFAIPEEGNVRLAITDVFGREIMLLVDERLPKGIHQIAFDGSRFPSGVYICRLVTGNVSLVRKITVVK